MYKSSVNSTAVVQASRIKSSSKEGSKLSNADRLLQSEVEQALLNTSILERERRAAKGEGRPQSFRAGTAFERQPGSISTCSQATIAATQRAPLDEYYPGLEATAGASLHTKQPDNSRGASSTPSSAAQPEKSAGLQGLSTRIEVGKKGAHPEYPSLEGPHGGVNDLNMEGTFLPASHGSSKTQIMDAPRRYANMDYSLTHAHVRSMLNRGEDMGDRAEEQGDMGRHGSDDTRALRDHPNANGGIQLEHPKAQKQRSPSKENKLHLDGIGTPLPPLKPHPADGVAAVLSVCAPSTSSPCLTGSGRKFMSAMSELRAGVSDEQRRHAEELRRRLREDLEEQVRQKKAEKEAQKAADLVAERREEARLQAYYSILPDTSASEPGAKASPEAAEPGVTRGRREESFTGLHSAQGFAPTSTCRRSPPAHRPPTNALDASQPEPPRYSHRHPAAVVSEAPSSALYKPHEPYSGRHALGMRMISPPAAGVDCPGDPQRAPSPGTLPRRWDVAAVDYPRAGPLAHSAAAQTTNPTQLGALPISAEVVNLLEQLRAEQAELKQKCAALEQVQQASQTSSRQASSDGMPPSFPTSASDSADELQATSHLVPATLNHIPADVADYPPPPLLALPSNSGWHTANLPSHSAAPVLVGKTVAAVSPACPLPGVVKGPCDATQPPRAGHGQGTISRIAACPAASHTTALRTGGAGDYQGKLGLSPSKLPSRLPATQEGMHMPPLKARQAKPQQLVQGHAPPNGRRIKVPSARGCSTAPGLSTVGGRSERGPRNVDRPTVSDAGVRKGWAR